MKLSELLRYIETFPQTVTPGFVEVSVNWLEECAEEAERLEDTLEVVLRQNFIKTKVMEKWKKHIMKIDPDYSGIYEVIKAGNQI